MFRLLFVNVILTTLAQRNPHFIDDRSVIVQMFEWPYNSLAEECELYLGRHNFGGIQISPVTENVIVRHDTQYVYNRPWWERYEPLSYNFTTRSGDRPQLSNMVRRCNDAGVRVFVDVVLNHMSRRYDNMEKGTGGHKAYTVFKNYPAVPFDSSHFHTTCKIDDLTNLTSLRICEVNGRQDLNQSIPFVGKKLRGVLNSLIKMGVAGFRIDSAQHVDPVILKQLLGQMRKLENRYNFPVKATPFVIHEVSVNDTMLKTEYGTFGVVEDYTFGQMMAEFFRGKLLLKDLKDFGTKFGEEFPRKTTLFFLDNPQSRHKYNVLTYQEPKLYKMATVFLLSHSHFKYVRLMSGYKFRNTEQGPPYAWKRTNENIVSPMFYEDESCAKRWICEHRWPQIKRMVQFRSVVKGTKVDQWWDNGADKIAYCRGLRGFVAISKSGDLKEYLQTCLNQGDYCDVISGTVDGMYCTGKVVSVDIHGVAYIEILETEEEGALVIHKDVRLPENEEEYHLQVERKKILEQKKMEDFIRKEEEKEEKLLMKDIVPILKVDNK